MPAATDPTATDSTPTDPTATDPTAAAEVPRRLRLYAARTADGEVRDTYLIRSAEQLAIWDEQGRGEELALSLPAGALGAIFARYGKPLDEELQLAELLVSGDEADLPLEVPLPDAPPALLRRFRFLPYGWVHPADYLLWQQPGREPLAAPAPLVASALTALGRAASRSAAR